MGLKLRDLPLYTVTFPERMTQKSLPISPSLMTVSPGSNFWRIMCFMHFLWIIMPFVGSDFLRFSKYFILKMKGIEVKLVFFLEILRVLCILRGFRPLIRSFLRVIWRIEDRKVLVFFGLLFWVRLYWNSNFFEWFLTLYGIEDGGFLGSGFLCCRVAWE